MPRITDLEARLFRVPLPEVMSDAKHGDHTHFELVTVTITTEVDAHRPEEDTQVEARIGLDVGVTASGACNQAKQSS